MKTFFGAFFGALFGTLAAFMLFFMLMGVTLQFFVGPAVKSIARSAGFDHQSMKDFAELSQTLKQFLEKMKNFSPAELQSLQPAPDATPQQSGDTE